MIVRCCISRLFRVAGCLILLGTIAGFPFRAVAADKPDTSAEDLAPLTRLSTAVESLVKKVSPSVVQILVTGLRPVGEGGREDAGVVVGKQHVVGAGAIIDPDGYIITNAHVVVGARQIRVALYSPGGEEAKAFAGTENSIQTRDATLVGVSREFDLALLKIEAKGLPALPLGNYMNLQQGEVVFAFGSPSGLRNSVSMGVISAVARQLDTDSPLVFIQTDAPINPGNSGGPLVNARGELVGINTFIVTQSGGNEGLGFAIPSAVVKYSIPQLRQYGHLRRGVIGIYAQTVSRQMAVAMHLPRESGVIIGDVFPDSPAEEAGLKIKDIILSVNGKPMDSLPLFGVALFTVSPGEKLKMEVLRNGEKLSFEIPLIEQKADVDKLLDMADSASNRIGDFPLLGLSLNEAVLKLIPEPRLASGVVVLARTTEGSDMEIGLVPGDIIHSINGMGITQLSELNQILDTLKPGSPVVLGIERGGKMSFLTFSLE